MEPSSQYDNFERLERAARDTCRVIEEVSNPLEPVFLHAVIASMGELLAAWHSLPDRNIHTDEPEPDVDYPDLKPLRMRLEEGFGKWNFFPVVFDPYEEDDEPVVYGSLGDVLADVWGDLHVGLMYLDVNGPVEAIEHWKTMEFHWSRHIVQALTALNSLIQRLEDEDEGPDEV